MENDSEDFKRAAIANSGRLQLISHLSENELPDDTDEAASRMTFDVTAAEGGFVYVFADSPHSVATCGWVPISTNQLGTALTKMRVRKMMLSLASVIQDGTLEVYDKSGELLQWQQVALLELGGPLVPEGGLQYDRDPDEVGRVLSRTVITEEVVNYYAHRWWVPRTWQPEMWAEEHAIDLMRETALRSGEMPLSTMQAFFVAKAESF